MIEGQEGVTWEQWRALACAAEARRARGPVPLRPLPLDPPRRAGRLARRVGDARRDRRGHRADPARDDGLARHLPATRRCSRRTPSPSTTSRAAGSSSGSAPAGTRPSTRSTASRSAGSASGSTSSTASSPRSTASGRTGSEAWPKPVQQPRPPIIVGGAAKPRSVRAAVALRRRVQHDLPVGRGRARPPARILDDAAREAGREPLVFSMMAGCVVGRDRAEARRAARPLARDHDAAGAVRRPSSGRSTRSPSACAPTRRPASNGRCCSTSPTRTSRWSRCSATCRFRTCLGPSSGPALRPGVGQPSGPDGLAPGVYCGTGGRPGAWSCVTQRRHDLVLGATLPVHSLDHRQHPVLFAVVAGVQPPHLRV